MQADPTSTSIFLVGKLTSPSVAARRAELTIKLRECLEKLDPDDREILSLRHSEQLSNRETAEELNVAPNVASVRYLRALKKFRVVLQAEKLDELLE
jgi:RNA polymerase sigma-70 factor (ECF subfamily)